MDQLRSVISHQRVLGSMLVAAAFVAAFLLLGSGVSAMPQLAEHGVTISAAAAPLALTCDIDVDGANDEANQKDLTKACADFAVYDPFHVTWNWDEISISQTADACALFDTNDDGLVNYAVCNQWYNGQLKSAGYPKVYACDNSKPQNCGGATALTNPATTCSVTNTGDDPFSAGAGYPNDTLSDCSVNMADFGGSATFLDVCSYPSASPSSVASDCVYVSATKGNLNVLKDVDPDDTVHNVTTNWNITVTGPTPITASWSGDGSTGIRAVNVGTYTITEAAGANTSLADYDTTWSCTVDGGTPTTGTGATISNVSIAKGQVVACTFKNTRKTGSLQIVKDVIPDDDTTKWSFAASGPWPFTCQITGDGSCEAQTVATGSYTIAETGPANYDASWVCTVNGGAGPSGSDATTTSITVGKNDSVVCTFTNTKRASVQVSKVTVDQSGQPINAGHIFSFQIDAANPPVSPFTLKGGTSATYYVSPNQALSVSEVYDIGEEGWHLLTGPAQTYCQIGATPAGTFSTSGAYPSETYTYGGITPAPGEAVFCQFTNQVSPTAVTLDNMSAAVAGTGVEVTWETAQETANQGFHLWRGTSPSGPDVRLNAAIIPAQNPGGTLGASYAFQDTYQLVPGTTYFYWLEDVDLGGAVTRHEPVSVTYEGPTAVRLAGPRAAGSLPAAWPLAGIALLAIGTAALIRRRAA
jgi:hypothetical protein